MAITIDDDFPHGGEHLTNDESQARMTLWILGIFAVAAAIVLIAVFAAM